MFIARALKQATVFTASKMDKNGDDPWADDSAWVAIINWIADTTGFPGSSVTSNQLDMQGVTASATIEGRAQFGGAYFNQEHTIRAVDQNGTVLATGPTLDLNQGTCTVDASGVDLTGITRIGLEMLGDSYSFANGNVIAAGTYLKVF